MKYYCKIFCQCFKVIRHDSSTYCSPVFCLCRITAEFSNPILIPDQTFKLLFSDS